MNIYLSMITHPRAGVSYLADTVMSLAASGLATSRYLQGFHIYQSHEPVNINVANSLLQSPDPESWILFIEDDILVCDDFVDSCARWLYDHSTLDTPVYSFGCNHPDITTRILDYWKYPIDKFFGTQCFAIRQQDAISLSRYLIEHCYDMESDGSCYDILMTRWTAELYPLCTHFLASCPSFVQHVGMESVIRPRDDVHTFPSWPGTEWRYRGGIGMAAESFLIL